MSNRIDVEQALSESSSDKVAAFSARSALRILPLLQSSMINRKKDPFQYWPKAKRSEYLLTLLRGAYAPLVLLENSNDINLAQIAISAEGAVRALVSGGSIGSNFIKANYAANSVLASLYIALGAAEEPQGVAMFSAFPWASGRDKSRYHLEFSSFAFEPEAYMEEIFRDISDMSSDSVTVLEFMNKPLWRQGISIKWRRQIDLFTYSMIRVAPGFSVWAKWYSNLISGNAIGKDDIKLAYSAPDEILAQGANALKSYIGAINNKSAIRPLNRVRTIFIGYGDAGKTSLIRVLHDEPVMLGKEPMTPGIEIREWKVPQTDIVAHFWDFGGQVMVHATHQLFLRSSCLYVLVISARSEISASEQAEYWLEHIKSFGAGAPVLIVGNRIEQADLNLDMEIIKFKYPNVVNYFPMSCVYAQSNYRTHAEIFKAALCKELVSLTTHQMMFTEQQFQLLNSLGNLSSKNSFIAKAHFDSLCVSHGIKTAGPQGKKWVLDILDKLGVIIHFANLPFADGYVLNPRWITYGIYTLMYAKKPQLSVFDVVELLAEKKVIDEFGNELHYPIEKARLILDAMHQFKLSYPLKNNADTVIIPALLQSNQPNFDFDKINSIEFEFSFGAFLPRNILPELIVNRYQEIIDQRVWQTGVNLRHSMLHAEALVSVDYHARKLSIWVVGINSKDYLALLRDEIDSILKRISVDYKEFVLLPREARITEALYSKNVIEKAPYKQLLACVVRGVNEFIAESGDAYDVGRVLRNFVTKEKQEIDLGYRFPQNLIIMESAMNGKVNILNNSTVGGDFISANDISNSFNPVEGGSVPENVKILLDKLISEINELKKNAPQNQAADINDIVLDAKSLVAESNLPEPKNSRLTRKLNGILEAAKSVGEVGKNVVETASLLAPLIGFGS